jgi:hypothetical protein
MQAVIEVVNETGCSSGLGGNIENDEQNNRPPDDLSEHLITSRAFSLQATPGGRSAVIPQHSPGQSTDQWRRSEDPP